MATQSDINLISSRPEMIVVPGVGDAAPGVTFLDAGGALVEIADLYGGPEAQRGLALVFLRHFGCPFCREHAQNLSRERDAFQAARVEIVMIGTGTAEQAAAFRRELDLRNRVLTDPDGSAYRAFGLAEAPLRSLLDPRVLAGGARAAMKGFLPRKPEGRALQLQGQFLIDRSGTIRSVARPRVMSEIPSAAMLLVDAHTLVQDQP